MGWQPMHETLNKEIIARMASLLGDKWAIPIINELMGGTKRFSDLESSLGVNPRTLSDRLKRLEAAAFISRQLFPEVPPRVEYTLTEKGEALYGVLKAIYDFGGKYLGKGAERDPAPSDG